MKYFTLTIGLLILSIGIVAVCNGELLALLGILIGILVIGDALSEFYDY